MHTRNNEEDLNGKTPLVTILPKSSLSCGIHTHSKTINFDNDFLKIKKLSLRVFFHSGIIILSKHTCERPLNSINLMVGRTTVLRVVWECKVRVSGMEWDTLRCIVE